MFFKSIASGDISSMNLGIRVAFASVCLFLFINVTSDMIGTGRVFPDHIILYLGIIIYFIIFTVSKKRLGENAAKTGTPNE